jgi:hypothetical protein
MFADVSGKPLNTPNPLYVDPAATDFSDNPKLLDRIISSPHGYFRFINFLFAQEVCRRFDATLPGTPSFNLHGDAHIEQYAVTDLGRGLTDFDYSCTGPAILDIMRFAVSLKLACRQNNWSDYAEEIFDLFLSGYRGALSDPDTRASEPELVKLIKKKFSYDLKRYYTWVESVMEPMPRQEEIALRRELRAYIATMHIENPTLAASFFDIKRMGYLRLGIGSALDQKYLIRFEGPGKDPFDDKIAEIKEVRDLSAIDCITVSQKNDPFRILVGQSRIAYQPYDYLGYIRFQGKILWIHAWVQNYQEIDIGKSFQNPRQLREVAYDISVQLGLGHAKQIAAPMDLQLRRAELYLLAKTEAQIKSVCHEMYLQIVSAWEMFRTKVEM